MKTATIREVQHHLGKVLSWVEKGEEVQITRRSKPVARLIPSGSAGVTPMALPDFAGRARAIWGTRAKGGNISKVILAGRDERQ